MTEFSKPLIKKARSAPLSPGVYLFSDRSGRIIYIGKASNLKSRISSYFRQPGPGGPLKSEMLREIAGLKWVNTGSEIEALILEANLIKKHEPRFNVMLKDASDYFYVGLTRQTFPKVFITHQPGKDKKFPGGKDQTYIGPFTDGTALKKSLTVIRKVFPFCTCREFHERPCLNSQIDRCLGVCCLKPEFARQDPGFRDKLREYGSNIGALKKILNGKKRSLIIDLRREMEKASRKEEYEKAAKLRDQSGNLEDMLAHRQILIARRGAADWPTVIRTVNKIFRTKTPQDFDRIEAYDISHISGTNAVGSMVVFQKDRISAGAYRRFKIRKTANGDDPAMMKEVLGRRLEHPEWPFPDLILIDGGRTQLNAALNAMADRHRKIPVMALAKKQNDLYLPSRPKPLRLDSLPPDFKFLVLRIRDQAHRFAVRYHRRLRNVK